MNRNEFIRNSVYGAGGLVVSSWLSIKNSLMMNEGIYRFRIGDFQAFLLHDMQFIYKGADFFSNIPPEEAALALKEYGHTMDKIPSPYVSLLLINGEHKILIDTGLGFRSEPMEFKGAKVPIQGQARSLLQTCGVSEADITDLVLTHFHPDHLGGVCDEELEPIFPNARYLVHQKEWDYWYSSQSDHENPLFRVFIQENIDPIKNRNLHLIHHAEEEIIPGIHAIKVPGHTPGQIALKIASKGEQLLFISDVWLHPLQIRHLDWETTFDLDHGLAKKSRINMLELAYRDNIQVQSFHFDFPGLGYIDRTTSGWNWVPNII